MAELDRGYDLDYFISKFEAIPEELWTEGAYTDPVNPNAHCALGHCGHSPQKPTPESFRLERLAMLLDPRGFAGWIVVVNDNADKAYSHLGPTPKQRVVNYLKALKEFYS